MPYELIRLIKPQENFTICLPSSREWWAIEPLYELARRSGAKAAVYFFPECEVQIPLKELRNYVLKIR